MDALLQDLRYALRTLGRNPGFTAAAVLTLALGIGAATAGFSLLNWLLLRPVAGVRQPSRAGLVWLAVHENGGYSPGSLTLTQREDVLHRSPAVAVLAGREGPIEVNAAPEAGTPQRISVEFVTSDYFRAVGVGTEVGRGFVPEDDAPPLGRRVVVIGERLWLDLFDERPDVAGQTLRVNGMPCTVIGVAARGFRGPDHLREADAWMAGTTEWDIRHLPAARRPPEPYFNRFVLRLRSGATFDQAAAQLQSAVRALALADTADFSPKVSATVIPRLGIEAMYGARDLIDHQLALVMGVAGLVLLVACANVANLLLFRRAQRRADIVVRLVLGAGRARLVRYALTESALVGIASGLLGALTALWLTGLFRHVRMLRFISLEGIALDWRVLAFAVVVGVLASLLAGLVPALLRSRVDLGSQLKAAGPTQAGGAPRLRSGLAVLQMAVSLTLVAGTYLLARTLQRYAAVPLGFQPAGVTVFAADPDEQGYTAQQARLYLRALQDRVAGLPGVQQVALVTLPPFLGIINVAPVRRLEAPADAKSLAAGSDQVSAEYFALLGIPVLRGRTFATSDIFPDSGHALGKVILSAHLARSLYGDSNAVGRIVVLPGIGRSDRAEVVGVVGDVHWVDRGGEVEPMLYTPVGQGGSPYSPMIAVRSHLAAATLEREVQRIGRGLDPALPIQSNGPLSETVAQSLASQTLLFRLVGLLSTVTLLLTAVGVYSLVAYGVTTRLREFGLRIALGAEGRDIVRTAARPAVAIVLFGVVIGIAGAAYLTRFIKASLYGVGPTDPVAFVTAVVVLGGAVLLASWVPARRAAKVDPMVALRYE
jgi:predicted permease